MTDLKRFYQYLDEHELIVLISRNRLLGTPWGAFIASGTSRLVSHGVTGKGSTSQEALEDLVARMNQSPLYLHKEERRVESAMIELPRFAAERVTEYLEAKGEG